MPISRLLTCALLFLTTSFAPVIAARLRAPGDTALQRFLDSHEPPPASYRAVRTLSAAARGGKMSATMTVVTRFDRESGFAFDVISEDGSGVIRNRVLRAALEAERTALQTGEPGRGALSAANYQFGVIDEAAGLVKVPLRPRHSGPLLLDGQMWLSASGDLLQVDGALVKRPSFWTRHVQVVRRWARIHGIRVPVSMESTAQVLLAGEATFAMHYKYEDINGLPVELEGR